MSKSKSCYVLLLFSISYRRVSAFTIILFCCILATPSYPKDTITWAVGDNPPRITFDGKAILGGQGGLQQKMLSQELSHIYNARYLEMNWARLEAEFAAGSKVCSSFLFVTEERKKIGAFSLPWHIDLPHRLVMLKDTYIDLGEPGMVSLQKIIQNKEIRGVIEKGRSYGKLDEIISDAISDSNLTKVSVKASRSIHMLQKGRMEFTIEYPYYTNYFQQLNGNPESPIVMVPIKEAEDYYFAHIGCSNTPWGRTVIENVNKVIKKVRTQSSFLELLKLVYINEDDKNEIEHIYTSHFLPSE